MNLEFSSPYIIFPGSRFRRRKSGSGMLVPRDLGGSRQAFHPKVRFLRRPVFSWALLNHLGVS
ncbi:MAG: hypothetical protein CW346_10865 [Bacillaceae bacterium]|nr:hypothetical protein [Bacillaceae bacterium]